MRLARLTLPVLMCLVGACSAVGTGSGGQSADSMGAPMPLGAVGDVETAALEVLPGSREEFQSVGDRVFFNVDRFDLTDAARATLERQAAWLQRYPSRTIIVQGHADERGTREYNLALGDRRANAVRNYLVSQGVSAGRLDTISYGKERPAVVGSNESAWAQSRRGVSVITGGAPIN